MSICWNETEKVLFENKNAVTGFSNIQSEGDTNSGRTFDFLEGSYRFIRLNGRLKSICDNFCDAAEHNDASIKAFYIPYGFEVKVTIEFTSTDFIGQKGVDISKLNKSNFKSSTITYYTSQLNLDSLYSEDYISILIIVTRTKRANHKIIITDFKERSSPAFFEVYRVKCNVEKSDNECNDELKRMKIDLAALHTQKQSLESELITQKNTKTEYEATIAINEGKKAESTKQKEEEYRRISETATKEVTEYTTKQTELKKEYEQSETEKIKINEIISNLKITITETEEKIRLVTIEIDRLITEIQTLQVTIDNSIAKELAIKTEIQSEEQIIARRTQEIEELRKDIEIRQRIVTEKQKRLETEKQIIKSTKETLSNKQSLLTIKTTTKTTEIDNLTTNTKEIKAKTNQLTEIEIKISTLKQSIEKFTLLIAEKRELIYDTAKIIKITKESLEKDEKHQGIEAELLSLKAKLTEINTSIELLIQSIAQKVDIITSHTNIQVKKSAECSELDKKLQQARNDVASKQADLQSAMDKIKESFGNLKSEYKTLSENQVDDFFNQLIGAEKYANDQIFCSYSVESFKSKLNEVCISTLDSIKSAAINAALNKKPETEHSSATNATPKQPKRRRMRRFR